MHVLLYGEAGLIVYREHLHEMHVQQFAVCSLEQEVAALNQEINDWHSNAFYLEKMAREELLMGLPHERVYIVPRREQNDTA